MCLPTLDDRKIDVEQTKIVVNDFMDTRFNYFNTAWTTPGARTSSVRPVERHPKENFHLATKNAA